MLERPHKLKAPRNHFNSTRCQLEPFHQTCQTSAKDFSHALPEILARSDPNSTHITPFTRTRRSEHKFLESSGTNFRESATSFTGERNTIFCEKYPNYKPILEQSETPAKKQLGKTQCKFPQSTLTEDRVRGNKSSISNERNKRSTDR